jgi:hypothetical protein
VQNVSVIPVVDADGKLHGQIHSHHALYVMSRMMLGDEEESLFFRESVGEFLVRCSDEEDGSCHHKTLLVDPHFTLGGTMRLVSQIGVGCRDKELRIL